MPTKPHRLKALRSAGRVKPVPTAALVDYLSQVAALRVHPGSESTGVRVVYTAMHGVGLARVMDVLGAAGHTDVHPVPEQAR